MTPETFFANFGHLADAPNGVQKLRELILSLAVRGKLVPQDPNDEPASVLLARIKAEKERLVKEKKIKKSEPLPPVSADEAPYELPQRWEWVRLGIITEIERGGSPRPINDYLTDADDGLNWIKIGDTEKGGKYITSTKEKIRKEGLTKTRMVFPGDFLLTNSMSFGRPYISKIEGCIHDGWLRIHPPEILEKDYLYYLLSSSYVGDFFRTVAAGAVVMNLNADKVRELPIPLPPLAEQHRVVAKVDQLMALCDELEERQQRSRAKLTRLNNAALDRLLNARETEAFTAAWRLVRDNFDLLYTTPETIANLRQAILQLAVQGKLVPQDPNDEPASVLLARIKAEKERLVKEKKIRKAESLPPISADEAPYELPRGWEIRRFAELADIVGGVTKGRNLAGRRTASFPYLRVANVQRGFLDLAIMKAIEIPVEELEKYKVCGGDLLITEGGDWDKVGRTAIWSEQIENCIHQNHVFRARLFTSELNHKWIMRYINSSLGRRYFENASKHTTNLASINMTQLRSCPIPIPPSAEQHRIVAKIDQFMDLCDELESKLTRSQDKAEKLAAATVKGLIAA